jgi:hypothetical protein
MKKKNILFVGTKAKHRKKKNTNMSFSHKHTHAYMQSTLSDELKALQLFFPILFYK